MLMKPLKCLSCGANVTVKEGESIVTCEYCGNSRPVPKIDDEKRLTLFRRADNFLSHNEFDKAEGIYETIIDDMPNETAAYWGIVLCRYGIEYVEDPPTGKRIPTCHRLSYKSILDDVDYKNAIQNADDDAKEELTRQANELERIRKEILKQTNGEKPFDIFISYKEEVFGESHERTMDSVLAQEIYQKLTAKGYRVFFSRITLREEGLGKDYEPVIFSALNSAKIMLLIGTSKEHIDSVWVRNEWSRYLALMSGSDDKRMIVCYRDMELQDLPKELQLIEAVNLASVGAEQDLFYNIERILPRGGTRSNSGQGRYVPGTGASSKLQSTMQSQLDRAQIFMGDGQWDKAMKCYETVLNADPKCAEAYMGEALCEKKVRNLDELKAILMGDGDLRIDTYNAFVTNKEQICAKFPKYIVTGYYDSTDMEKCAYNHGTYCSQVAPAKEKIGQLEGYFATNQNVAHAFEFAEGDFKVKLERMKSELLDTKEGVIEQAEQVEKKNCNEALERIENALENEKQDAEKRREDDYRFAYQVAVDSQIVSCASTLKRLGDYKDSAKRLKEIEPIADIQKQINEDGEGLYLAKRLADENWYAIKKYTDEAQKANAGVDDGWIEMSMFAYLLLAVFDLFKVNGGFIPSFFFHWSTLARPALLLVVGVVSFFAACFIMEEYASALSYIVAFASGGGVTYICVQELLDIYQTIVSEGLTVLRIIWACVGIICVVSIVIYHIAMLFKGPMISSKQKKVVDCLNEITQFESKEKTRLNNLWQERLHRNRNQQTGSIMDVLDRTYYSGIKSSQYAQYLYDKKITITRLAARDDKK